MRGHGSSCGRAGAGSAPRAAWGARVARVAGAGAVAGVALVGTWRGTTPLVLVAGLALLLAAFDAIEPLAQEVDHPTRRALAPVRSKDLLRAHLAVPLAALVAAALIGALAAFALTGESGAVAMGAAVALPAALAALAGAAVSVITDPFAWVLIPVAQNVRAAAPFVLAALGVMPLLAARAAVRHGQPAASALLPAGTLIVLVCLGALALLTGPLAPKEIA